jgi:hypothetical protein
MTQQKKFPDLCETFKELAAWTSNKLNKADRLQMAFNEETITESLLLKLAERHAWRDLSIRAYTKQEEGTGTPKTGGKATGADWSFWFGNTKRKGVEVRIQAKRMFTESGQYESLDGNGSQIKKLLKNAGSSIPLYVFYNPPVSDRHQWMPHIERHWCACALGWPLWGNLSDWGCSYSPVTAIPKTKKPKPSDIKWMMPWHCLACGCCLKHGNSASLPERIASVLEGAYEQAGKLQDDERFANSPQISFKLKETPEWVNLLENYSTRDRGEEDVGNSKLNSFLNDHGLDGVASIVESEERR